MRGAWKRRFGHQKNSAQFIAGDLGRRNIRTCNKLDLAWRYICSAIRRDSSQHEKYVYEFHQSLVSAAMVLSRALELESRPDNKQICIRPETLRIFLQIESLECILSPVPVHEMPFDLHIPMIVKIEP